MQIIRTISQLQHYLNQEREAGKSVGFVPTMGALHKGHFSLVERSRKENDLTLVSIFVNPTQFNNKEDLVNYPRMPEKDAKMLEEAHTDILFLPEVEEMYPGTSMQEKLPALPESLSGVMEGAFRPGHFDGVMQVVHLLFTIVQPHRAYFGEKDFQQLAVVRYMKAHFHLPVEVIGCPTVREADGLAMSSRNLRLNKEQREDAAYISKALYFIREHRHEFTPAELKAKAEEIISSRPSLKTEYLEIADATTLAPLTTFSATSHPHAFVAVFCGPVRLIDNVSID